MKGLGGGVLAVIAVLVAGCAEQSAQTKALCPGLSPPRCLTRVICDHDRERGCEVCRCETPFVVPTTQPPQGAPKPLSE